VREELLVEARVGHEVGVDEQHPVGPAVVDGDVAQGVDGVQAAGMEVGEDQVEVDALAEGRYGCEIRGQVPAVDGDGSRATPSFEHLHLDIQALFLGIVLRTLRIATHIIRKNMQSLHTCENTSSRSVVSCVTHETSYFLNLTSVASSVCTKTYHSSKSLNDGVFWPHSK
jgi:hypothetical protein